MSLDIDSLKAEISWLKAEKHDLEEINKRLSVENDVLKNELARVGALGSAEKERLLRQVLKVCYDCYSNIDFDEAFDKAAK